LATKETWYFDSNVYSTDIQNNCPGNRRTILSNDH
jgi:hypothetical protein